MRFSASKSLACLNHTELRGNPMRIMWRQGDAVNRKTRVGNVIVKHLDPSITSDRLYDFSANLEQCFLARYLRNTGIARVLGLFSLIQRIHPWLLSIYLHGPMFEGKNLYVSKFVQKSQREDDYEEPKFTNLYVKNLGEFVIEDVLEKFSEHGAVRKVLIMKDAEGKSKGFGFVNFDSYEEAKKAVEAFNGALLGSGKLFVGKVTSAKVMCNDSGISKEFGFLSFSTPEEGKKELFFNRGICMWLYNARE